MSVLSRAIKDNVPIIDYAEELGYHVKRIGRVEYTLEEHDSVRINAERNIFIRNSTNQGGSVIDFAMFALKIDEEAAIKHLRKKLNSEQIKNQTSFKMPEPKVEIPIVIPKKNSNYKRLFAFLCKTRCIDGDVVSDLIHRKMLFEDAEHHNVVWLGYDYDNTVKFGCKRVTITDPQKTADGKEPFIRGDLLGSKKHIGMFVDNNATDLFVTEAPIDAMSLMTLFKLHNRDYNSHNYLAQAGTNGISSLIYHLLHQPKINKIYLCYDNDDAGKEAIITARNELSKVGYRGKIINKIPTENDWNDDLKKFVREKSLAKEKNNQKIKEIKPIWEISY